MNPENALVSRRVFDIDGDRVVVEEVWNLSHPDSPFIPNPWTNPLKTLSGEGIRQRIMSSKEFWRSNIPLKAPSHAGQGSDR